MGWGEKWQDKGMSCLTGGMGGDYPPALPIESAPPDQTGGCRTGGLIFEK